MTLKVHGGVSGVDIIYRLDFESSYCEDMFSMNMGGRCSLKGAGQFTVWGFEGQSLLWLIAVQSSSSLSSEAQVSIAKPGCMDHCGKVKIPYPFGIGLNCSYNASYEIACRNGKSFYDGIPFLQLYNLEIIQIYWTKWYSSDPLEFSKQILAVRTPATHVCGSRGAGVPSLDFKGSPFRFSGFNDFMVVGCGGSVLLKNRSGNIVTGCASVCPNDTAAANIETTSCFGVGCCRSALAGILDEGLFNYDLAVDNHTIGTGSGNCTLAAGLINSYSVGKIGDLTTFSTLLDWSTEDLTTDIYMPGYVNVSCGPSNWGGNLCWCNKMHEGNPYLGNCQVPRECRKCRHHCNYTTDSGGSEVQYHCVNPFLQRGPILGFSLGVGSVLLLLFCYWLYKVIMRKREAKRRAKYFERNGGLLLQQHMSSGEGAFEKTKIFQFIELEKATNNFSTKRILGQGGQGTVYKGMLTDGKIVAIKKSKRLDEGQLEHFINELVILSQINHRNVVKLLGCCLETEVPLLVYEFIPNGTLYELLHAPSEDFQCTWKMRLQIAAESADAISYLHSSSATPVYHRDIKSANILLDEKFREKVSDFGTSRAITIEQTHVTTYVMGTYGYLDPEYFRSNQFTEKSDVYSFVVVLVELITGKKAVFQSQSGEWISLASEFLSCMETSCLSDMLDARVLDEGKEEEFVAVANLARQCLSMSGKQRPSMKEITVVLDGIRSNKVPSLKESQSEGTKSVVTEMTDLAHAPLSSGTFCSDNNKLGSYGSIDA